MAVPEFLTRQLGPLPVGGWLGVIGAGAGIGYVIRRRGGMGGSPPAEPVAELLPGDTAPGVGNLGVGDDDDTPSLGGGVIGGPSPRTNEEWRIAATRALLARGFAPGLVTGALAKYLTGDVLSVAERAVIDLAILSAGPTPQFVPPPYDIGPGSVDPPPPNPVGSGGTGGGPPPTLSGKLARQWNFLVNPPPVGTVLEGGGIVTQQGGGLSSADAERLIRSQQAALEAQRIAAAWKGPGGGFQGASGFYRDGSGNSVYVSAGTPLTRLAELGVSATNPVPG